MHEIKIARLAALISFTLVALMWIVYLIQFGSGIPFYAYGIKPLALENLTGILFSPFIHDHNSFGHIINNTLPTFVLTWLLFYHYRTIALQVFVAIFLLTGFSMWLLARDAYHIGMSGVIYGLASFLVTAGFFRKNMRVAAVSLFVVFLYGSMVWGIFPRAINISWEGHALGLFTGIIIAVITKTKGPQPNKLLYEIEEELGIEPENEYWKSDEEKTAISNSPLIINYEFKDSPKDEKSQGEQSS